MQLARAEHVTLRRHKLNVRHFNGGDEHEAVRREEAADSSRRILTESVRPPARALDVRPGSHATVSGSPAAQGIE
jgi:hypothetical protein